MASSNEGTKTPTFMDRFALHLAKELVGSKTVLQVLNQHLPDAGDKSMDSVGIRRKDTPLYWRSDLFLEDPADMVNASKWPCCSNHKNNNNNNGDGDGRRHLLYLDAKFEFCIDKPPAKTKKQVKTTWGCFVLHSSTGQGTTTTQCNNNNNNKYKKKNYGMYYKSKPTTLSCLEKHVESMDIDLPEQPQNMAKFMRPALQVVVTKTKNSKGKGKNIFPDAKPKKKTKEFHIQLKDAIIPSENEKTIKLELYYEELNDKGVLTLELEEEASSPYNELGMEPFYLREIMCSTTPEEEETTPASRNTSQSNSSNSQQGLVGSRSPYGNQTPTKSFGSPANNNATPSPAKNNNLIDLQLDQALDEWFRLPSNNNDDDDDDSQKEDEKKNPVAAAAKPSPAIANNNKKRPPPKNLQNHGMRKIKKKKKKGGLFG